jgi:hypothetical protein
MIGTLIYAGHTSVDMPISNMLIGKFELSLDKHRPIVIHSGAIPRVAFAADRNNAMTLSGRPSHLDRPLLLLLLVRPVSFYPKPDLVVLAWNQRGHNLANWHI